MKNETPITDSILKEQRDHPYPLDTLVSDLTDGSRKLELALRERGFDASRLLHRAHIAEADARQAKARMDSAIEAANRIIGNCEEAYAHRVSAITTLKDAKEILGLLTCETQ